jgi:hypothetical protein
MRSRWIAFWFHEGNTLALGLFRILFAYALYREVGTTAARSRFAIEGGFHLPYLPLLEPVSEATYGWIHGAQYPLILLLAVGLFTRGAIGGLLLLQGFVFFVDQLNFRNDAYFFLLVLLLLLFSPCTESASLKRWLRHRRGGRDPREAYLGVLRPMTAQRLIQMQVSIVYLYAALHKVNGWFLSGAGLSTLASSDLLDDFSGELLQALLSKHAVDWLVQFVEHPGNLTVAAYGTVVLELYLAIALWFRPTRRPAILAGVGLHLGIALLMNDQTFSTAMLASYLLFLESKTLPRWLARLFGESAGSRRPEQKTAHPEGAPLSEANP